LEDGPSCVSFSCGRYGKATFIHSVVSRGDLLLTMYTGCKRYLEGVNFIVNESLVTFAVVCYE